MEATQKTKFLSNPLMPGGFFTFKKSQFVKLFKKSTATVLVLTFSWAQLVWAIDVRQMLLDAKASFEEESGGSMPSGGSVENFQQNQTMQQNEVEQQQALQDLQNMNFSLTTANGDILSYVGDKLSEVKRPDGTALKNIQTDLNGNILAANLKLSDGSLQVYQNGQILGYQTPDGRQIFYETGRVAKVIEKNGLETIYSYVHDAGGTLLETVLENSTNQSRYDAAGKLKESTNKTNGVKIYYADGIIRRIVKADGQTVEFSETAQGDETVLTPSFAASGVYTDPSGHVFYLDAEGEVERVVLADGTELENLVWNLDGTLGSTSWTDSGNNRFFYGEGAVYEVRSGDGRIFLNTEWNEDGSLRDTTLLLPDGSQWIYQGAKLVQSVSPESVVTDFDYAPGRIFSVSQGIAREYLADKTPLKTTWPDGSTTLYLTEGPYKGLRQTDTTSSGVATQYEYIAGADGVIKVEKGTVVGSVHNSTTIQGQSFVANSSNPALKFSVFFPNDNSVDSSATATTSYASGSSAKPITLKLVPGSGSHYIYNGVTTTLDVNLSKDVFYNAEIRWESGRVGLYVYEASKPRPAPVRTISNRSGDPKFKVVSTNASISLGSSSGSYVTTSKVEDKNNANQPGNPYQKTDFKFLSASSSNKITLSAKQVKVGNITRTLTAVYQSGRWTLIRSDHNSSTGQTTNTVSTLAQSLAAGKDYVAELRMEGTSAKLYVYEKGQPRPETALGSMTAYTASTRLWADLTNAVSKGVILKNISTPPLSSVRADELPAEMDALSGIPFRAKTIVLSKNGLTPDHDVFFEYSSVVYDADKRLKKAVAWDGTVLYFEEGLLKSVRDANGEETTFNFAQSSLSNAVGTEIVQGGASSKYDAEGHLSEIKLNGLAVRYRKDASIDSIEKEDGTEIYAVTFNADGSIQDATVVAPDGEERVYVSGKLVSVTEPDSTRLFYVDEALAQIITPEALTYDFSYTPDLIEANLVSPVIPDALTPVRMRYDSSFNLKAVIRQNDQIIHYLDNTISQIDLPDEAPQVFEYQKDADGKIISYTVTQGNVKTFYDANNNPVKAIISQAADSSHTLEAFYQYGKIREIKKNGILTFKYSYAFDSAGVEQVSIEDLEEKSLKVYKDGNLLTSLDAETSVLSSYSYLGGKVSKVETTRSGRPLHTYNYSYVGDRTVVTDEEGKVRTYGGDKKLLYLEKNGQKFSYTYHLAKGPNPVSYTDKVLPLSTYDTSSRDQWNGQGSWYEESGDALVTWSSAGLEYTILLDGAGDLLMNFETINPYQAALPPGYPGFQLQVFVDGKDRGIFTVPASPSGWQDAEIQLNNITAGSHVIRVQWVNDAYSAGAYDANFKFRNLRFAHKVPNYPDMEITEEKLVEKRLAGGVAAHYEKGRVTAVDLADGTSITDIVLDGNRNILKATKNFSDGSKKIFNQTSVLEDIQADGTRFIYDSSRLSKVVDAQGSELAFSYEINSSGVLTAVWVQKGVDKFKYSPSGSLLGLKLGGVLTPAEIIASAQHSYAGGSGGAYSIDGNFETAQAAGFGGGTGNTSVALYSEHTFSASSVITRVTYRLAASAYSNGSSNNGSTASSYIQVQDATTGAWSVVSGTNLWQSHNNGGGGGSTAHANTANPAVVTVNISNVKAIRAYVVAGAYNNGGGNYGGSAYIYELQYDLADLSFYAYSNEVFKNAANQSASVTGYSPTTPYASKINPASSPETGAWFSAVQDSVLASGDIVSQEYSADGTLETQTKAGGTVTLFENNKPSKVIAEDGTLLVLYSYDAQGHPSRVYLKNARDTLPDEVLRAKLKIEEERVLALKNLAIQKNLAYQSIAFQADAQRVLLQAQLDSLQGQYDGISDSSAYGKQAKGAKADTLSQLGDAIHQVLSALITVADNEADAYASLDIQVRAVSDQIEADAQKAYVELDKQEAELKKEILRQEISPIVYDYYRRILGRDPSSAEYDTWISRADYSSGENGEEIRVVDPNSPGADPALLAFQESGGVVAASAPHYHAIAQGAAHAWSVDANGHMVAGPDTNTIYYTDISQAPRLDFKVRFSQAGTYYLWVRGVTTDDNDNSVHAGLDGVPSPTSLRISNFTYGGASWTNRNMDPAVVTLTVSSAGEHTINFWMREDGFRFDRFILTTNASFVPSAAGLAESGRVSSEVTVKALGAALEEYLTGLPELAERQAYVTTIQQNVRQSIESYLGMTDPEKAAFASTLGLAQAELTALTSFDGQKILSWLDSRSLHFGQSAFLSLEALLDQKGIVYNRTELATRAILADILSGVITPLDDGDLVISVFALNKVAKLYGVSLLGANLSWEDLLALYQVSPASRVIAHINGNHFVIVTAITATSVTYIDTGIGKDKQNEVKTISKKEFVKVWRGYAALESAKGQYITDFQGKVLSADQTQRIRGAFLGFLVLAVASLFSAISGAVAAVISGVSAILSAVGTIVSGALSIVSQGLNLALQGIGYISHAVFTGIKFAASTLFNLGQHLFATVSGQSFFGGLSQAAFGDIIFKNAVALGVNFGLSRGLEGLGVNPTAASLISAFATGGVSNAFNAGLSAANFVMGGVKSLALAGSQTILNQIGVDPILGQTLSLIAQPFVNGVLSGDIAGSTVKITQNLPTNLSFFGLQKLGESLGLDSRISSFISAPLAAVAGATWQQFRWGGQNAISGQSQVTVSDSYIDGSEGKYREIRFEPGTPEKTWWDSVADYFETNLSGMIQSGFSAYYLAQGRPVNLIQPSDATVVTEAPLPAGAVAVSYQDIFTGEIKQGYQINTSQTSSITYDRLTGAAVKRVSPGIIEEGSFEYKPVRQVGGTFSIDLRYPSHLSQGKVYYTSPSEGQVTFSISDKSVQELRIEVESPDIVLEPSTTKDPSNKIINGVVKFLSIGLTLYISNGEVSKDSSGNSLSSESLNKALKRAFVFGNGFENERRGEDTPDPLIESYVWDLDGRKNTPVIIDKARELMFYLYEMTKIIGNAIDWFGDFKSFEANFILNLLEGPAKPLLDFLGDSAYLAALPDPLKTYLQNLKIFVADYTGIGNNLVDEVIRELDAKGPIEEGIAFVHSGATAPLLRALGIKPYDIRTVLIYEGPHPNYLETINNPYLERIIHVRGTGTVFDGDSPIPFLGWAHFGGINNINIEIQGAFHSDFSYSPANYLPGGMFYGQSAERKMVNRRVNLFMRDLYQAVLKDQVEPSLKDLERFFLDLERTGAAFLQDGIWRIFPDKLRDEIL